MTPGAPADDREPSAAAGGARPDGDGTGGTGPAGAHPGGTGPGAAAAYRTWGPEVAEVLARYATGLVDRPVGPSVEPGWLLDRLPRHPPDGPEPMDRVLHDVGELILPAMVHWQSPAFHAYFPANTSWPAALADFLAAGLGQQGMLWATSPAATELEMRMLDWVAELCGLPARFRHDDPGPGGGVIQDSASSGTLVALLAARERAGGREELHRQVVYASGEAHSSVVKGARIAGFREDLIRRVPTDGDLALDPRALAAMLADDVAAGLLPVAAVATVGTTSTMAVDPVRAMAEVCAPARAWVHVDAAMAGAATICGEHRDLLDGVDLVDSYLFNPHKWWGVTFDCTTMWVADRGPLLDALAITPAYLRNEASEQGSVVDFRDWQVPLGRRFRSLKLWFVLRATGVAALAAMVRSHVAEAGWLAERVAETDRWELAAPPRLNLVCVRHAGGDAATREAAARINESGRALVNVTEVDGAAAIRLSVGSPATAHVDVEALWSLLTA